MKKGNWFWGAFFICSAALVILLHLELLPFGRGLSPLTLLFTVVLTAIAIKSAVHLQFTGVLFSLALLCIVFSKSFDYKILDDITPWPVLIAALLGSIGLHIIFGAGKWKSSCDSGYNCDTSHIASSGDSADGSSAECTARFGSASKYLHSDCLERVNVNCSFGAVQVYFDNTQPAPNGVTAVLSVSFGGVELYVPRGWRVKNGVSAVFGGVELKENFAGDDAPTLNLTGNLTFSGVEVHFI